jgi:hypothetical protein
MRLDRFTFGSIRIDGTTYDHDVVIDGGSVHKRKKGPSKRLREAYGHTPLSIQEDLPWDCDRLVIGTGAEGSLPVLPEVREQARRRRVELVELPTSQAVDVLNRGSDGTNAVLHLTC